MARYAIGIDFGTLSGRAVLADIETGKVLGSRSLEYPHAVMDRQLPTGEKLGNDWALQHPQDYLDVLDTVLPPLTSMVNPDDIIGIGIDMTSSTNIPVDKDGVPLCSVPIVAQRVGVSPSYLTALFHQNLQISPGEYIRRIKLQESKQMIRENSMNFTEIAAALQYSTVHHFSRQFKEKFGITPSEYARSVR